MDESDALQDALRGLRLRRNEAQLTRFIAALSKTDESFAGALAQVLVAKAPENTNFSPEVDRGFVIPARLKCHAEERVWDTEAISQGYVDLLFHTDDRRFTLLAELKLHSGYGRDQVRRYLRGLEVYRRRAAGAGGRAGLVSVTRNPPVYGEPEKREQGWLGSVRWAAIVDQLRELEHRDGGVTVLWRSLLSILDEQGDLGMTGIEREAVEAWARYTEGRRQLEALLQELSQSIIEVVRETLADHGGVEVSDGLARLAGRGRSGKRLVFPHQRSVHLKIFIPAERPRERLRIQFAARGTRGALFSVEARHGDARRLPSRVQDNLRRIEEELRRSWGVETAPGEAGFRTDFHGYWSHRRSLDDWLGDGGPDIAERLVSYVREDVKALVQSGIFSQEDGLCFHAPEAAEPPADEEEGPVEGE